MTARTCGPLLLARAGSSRTIGGKIMATHRLSLSHAFRHHDDGRPHAELNFWLFMLAPAIMALTLVAVSLLSPRTGS
jgi:hypothetical protein